MNTHFPDEIFQDFTVISIPTVTNFRGIDHREVALFRGSEGWSEFSPFLEYERSEASHWLKAAVRAAYRPWPKLYRESIRVNAIIPNIDPSEVAPLLKNFAGCTTVKIKVNEFEDGAALIEEVLAVIPDARIRLDVNGGWTLREAVENLYEYHSRFGDIFEYIEQPCRDLLDLRRLKRETPFKIAADESIRKNLDGSYAQLSEYADIAMLKWAPVGGFEVAHEIISSAGLPVVISSALDTGIGIAHGAALAASFPKLDFACGLATIPLLESDICEPALLPQNCEIVVERREPSERLIHKYRASEERAHWWKNRVSDIWNNERGSEWL